MYDSYTDKIHWSGNIRGVQIDVVASAGIYTFYSESGAGKTYLHDLLSTNMLVKDAEAFSYTYTDFVKGVKIDDIVKGRNVKFLFIDRYDMMQGKLLEEIEKYAKSSIVVLDTKHNVQCSRDNNISVKNISINLTDKRIEVIQNDIRVRGWARKLFEQTDM